MAFGSGITVNATTVVSDTELTANIAIAETAAAGVRTVMVTNPNGEEGSLAGAFAVVADGPRQITITGTGEVTNWTAEVDGVAVTPTGDNRVTITIEPGDEIIWMVSGGSHGVVFDTQAQMEALLDIEASQPLGARPQSLLGQDLFGGDGFGTAQHGGGTELMRATVKDVADLTQTLDFTCFIHGPGNMNGTLVFEQAEQPAPTVAALEPAEGAPGDTLDVTITGGDFQDGADADFGAGITVNDTTFDSATELTANIAIAAGAALGARTVTVTNPDGQAASLADAFAVADGPRQITITGTGPVNWIAEVDGVAVPPAGDNRVTITVEPGDEITWLVSGSVHGVVFESEAQMEALLDIEASQPLAARAGFFNGDGFGTAQHGGGTELMRATVKDVADLTQTLDFTCFIHGPGNMNGTLVFEQAEQPAPTVAALEPAEGAPGDTLDVTITGGDFQDGADADFGAGITVNDTTFDSATELTANIAIAAGAALGARTVTVTNPDGQAASLADAFAVADGPRQITITGTGPVNWIAEVDGVAVPPAGDNRVTITVEPGDEITWLVSGSVHGVVFESEAQMEALLDIEASQPLAARAGFFNGDGFGTAQHGGGTELMRATVKDVADLTQTLDFTCFIHGPGNMNGTLVFEQAEQPAPTVAALEPAEGAPGDTLDVTITGGDFQDGADADFGAGITVNDTTFDSATELTANIAIAAGAALGARTVTVTNPDGQAASLADAFAVADGPRQITITGTGPVNWIAEVDGVAVPPAGDNRVTITVEPGDEITWLVSGSVHGVVFESEAQMEALLDIEASQPLAARAGFFNGDGFGTAQHGGGTELMRATVKDVADLTQTLDFTCFIHGPGNMNGTLVFEQAEQPAPTVAALEPAEGAPGDTLDVTITGGDFQDGADADFGAGITVNDTTFDSATELTANIAIAAGAALGARTVTVTNPDGQAASLADAFAVADGPRQITITGTGPVNWIAEVDGVAVPPAGDNRVTITVEPGDEITWLVSGSVHGVVFESEAQMEALLDIEASQPLAARAGFFNGDGFGTAQHGGGTELMRATVKDVADLTQTLDFTCFIHGPGNMNGTLVFQ